MSEEDEQMSNKEHTAVEAVEDFRYKRVLEEQYLNREKKSIESSRKTILLERERLEADRYDLSEHLYQEIQQDLMVLTQDLQARESSFEARKQHYEEQSWESRSQEEQVNAKRPFWKRWKERVDTFLEDAALDGDILTRIAVALVLAVATIVEFLTIVF